jgi:serine phosphatase RsbU (regulator of sigma subunit)
VYEEQRIEMAIGDTRLLYSDGLSEATSETGEMFGDGRVLEMARRVRGMPAAGGGRLVLDSLAAFVGEARPSDDLSLAIIRRLPEAAASRR